MTCLYWVVIPSTCQVQANLSVRTSFSARRARSLSLSGSFGRDNSSSISGCSRRCCDNESSFDAVQQSKVMIKYKQIESCLQLSNKTFYKKILPCFSFNFFVSTFSRASSFALNVKLISLKKEAYINPIIETRCVRLVVLLKQLSYELCCFSSPRTRNDCAHGHWHIGRHLFIFLSSIHSRLGVTVLCCVVFFSVFVPPFCCREDRWTLVRVSLFPPRNDWENIQQNTLGERTSSRFGCGEWTRSENPLRVAVYAHLTDANVLVVTYDVVGGGLYSLSELKNWNIIIFWEAKKKTIFLWFCLLGIMSCFLI